MDACDRKGVGSMITGIPKMGVKTMKLNTGEVYGGPDELVEEGKFEMGDGTKTVDKGNYIVIWKKDDGKWKIFHIADTRWKEGCNVPATIANQYK